MKKQCQNCINFKLLQGVQGICKLVKNCIGENCNKYQYCKDFKSAN